MADTPVWQTLVSGFAGAAMTLLGNNFFQWRNAKKSRKSDENRLCHLYYARIAQIPASVAAMKDPNLEAAVQFFVRGVRETLGSQISISHGLIAVLYYATKNNTDPNLNPAALGALLSDMIGPYLDEALNVNIPPEVLARFPKKTMVLYEAFVMSVVHTKSGFDLWVKFFGGEHNIEVGVLYSAWIAAVQMYNIAIELCSALKAIGEISDKDTSEIYDKHRQLAIDRASAYTKATEPLAAAIRILEARHSTQKRGE